MTCNIEIGHNEPWLLLYCIALERLNASSYERRTECNERLLLLWQPACWSTVENPSQRILYKKLYRL